MDPARSMNLERFDGNNFRQWKFQIKCALKAKGIDISIPKPEINSTEWLKNDGMAMFIITSSMDFKQITLIENCETAKEIMEKLESIYEQKSELCKMLIHEKFYQYKMSENDSVAQHISKVENLAKQLKESGESNKPRKHLKESSDMLAFNVEISSYNTEENAWIMDSGASAHMTFRKDFFVELLKCSEKSLTLGNKQSVEVSGIEYLDKEGIVHELTAPYTPEQNGRAEREIRTIVESARSMLYARDLPLDLWAEAVNCAVYILNRTSSSQTPGKTPYELWNGTKPELGHLKVFGSIGYVHVPDQLRTKLEKKSEKMLLIGYDNTNYRMYDMNKKTIKISRNVIFDEHQVPEVRKNITQICTIDDNEETTIQNNETEVRNMDETLIKTTVSESDDSLLSCNNDDPTYEPSQEIEDIMSHRNITLRPRNNRRFEANLVELSLPQTYDEALQSPQKYEWSQAIKEELSAHKENNTWNAVPRAGQRTLTTKWVFTIKKVRIMKHVTRLAYVHVGSLRLKMWIIKKYSLQQRGMTL
ncbi:Retrovirus-related Pol polyprotein from transposon TNT 1-94 [Eumeta japonica]|uniref:Retrovirus-related Pol polyprotein from transposon TNT 1-94 n=1 Tax=Eumeta variegata TaxID=151549 RepID=A0A4C1V8H3_EUMVA|nr:Retrovirus-related Pol polyprotein from transposon TNT 1-94 [Eumeta japonica]